MEAKEAKHNNLRKQVKEKKLIFKIECNKLINKYNNKNMILITKIVKGFLKQLRGNIMEKRYFIKIFNLKRNCG